MTKITPEKLEVNYIPVETSESESFEILKEGLLPNEEAKPNKKGGIAPDIKSSNISKSAEGETLVRGSIQSPNFKEGKSGWKLSAEGKIIAPGGGLTAQFIGGDGSDGDVVINDGGTTQLTSDMYYDNLTITANSTLQNQGYRIFVKNVLRIDRGSKIEANGNNGTNGQNGDDGGGSPPGNGNGGSGGAAVGNNYLYGGEDGKDGGRGGAGGANTGGSGSGGQDGTAGDSPSNAIGSNGVVGGSGGSGGDSSVASGGSGGSGGTAGTATKATEDDNEPQHISTAIRMYGWDADKSTGDWYFQFAGSAGTGGSGGGGGGAGGAYNYGGRGGGGAGSGSTGGMITVICGTLKLEGVIKAIGGNGGNGGDGGSDGNNGDCAPGGGGAAGSGASGGVVVIVCGYKEGTGSINVSAGTAGTIGSAGELLDGANSSAAQDGNAGNAGNTGSYYLLYA